ncbi:outer membrane beta-barrel protein [Rhizobium sp. S163]|uniref:outer membrane protein n=1 Tax=Rhizobium sp. S163 TaxID=3055039 RepID=UPI0025A9DBC8|nr:outer membrane beta-barrel protein [Rhizobium sp. S163]MDM9644456.1 outer membrane beta-barrel protein [Rhizobium sp. S163]
MRIFGIACALLIGAQSAIADDFSGGYAGGGIAIGTSADRVFPTDDSSHMDSPSGIAFGGLNFSYGDFVFGPELSLRANLSPQTISESQSTSGAIHWRSTYQETFAPTLSFRAGAKVDRFLLYGRAGLGTSRIKWVGEEKTPFYEERETDHLSGIALSGALGAEYNLDRFFVRLEGEVRRLQLDGDTNITEYQANTAIGVRF